MACSLEFEDQLGQGLLYEFRSTHNDYKPRFLWRPILPWIFHSLLLCTSALLFSASFSTGFVSEECSACLAQSTPTMQRLLPSKKKVVRFEGTFNRSSSPYKGPPSPAVDKAWDRLLNVGAMRIDEEIYKELNASKYAVKVPQALGGGRMALFETIHQIHYVRDLWQVAYPENYISQLELSGTDLEMFLDHIDHCADILRQKLICDADTNLITYSWLKGHWAPHPNFNVQHECRDFEGILSYAHEHRIDPNNTTEGYLLRPEDGQWKDFEEPPFDPMAEE